MLKVNKAGVLNDLVVVVCLLNFWHWKNSRTCWCWRFAPLVLHNTIKLTLTTSFLFAISFENLCVGNML